MMPGVAVTLDGLREQNLIAVRGHRRIVVRGDEHRHEPDADCREEGERSEQPARAAARRLTRLPARIAQQRERYEDEQRQEADALRDHAEPGRSPTDHVPAPRRSEQQVTQQTVQAERRPETQRRIDLRLPCLPYELHRKQQRQCARESRFATPQAAAEIVDQRDAAECSEKRRQQEGDAQRMRRLQTRSEQPEEQRRLVGVRLPAHARQQPISGRDHVARHEREARLVRWPRISQADASSDQQQREREQPEQIRPRRCGSAF